MAKYITMKEEHHAMLRRGGKNRPSFLRVKIESIPVGRMMEVTEEEYKEAHVRVQALGRLKDGRLYRRLQTEGKFYVCRMK